jgi:hypothetical protein
MAHTHVRTAAILAVIALLACTAPALAKKGPPVAELTNNLSYPAVAADGFAIPTPPATNPSLNTVYDIDPSTAEIEPFFLDGLPCYAQKVTDNKWQAAWVSAATTVGVFGVDWGDNVDSVYPAVRRPYRLELVLYDEAADWPETAPGSIPANAFSMAVLANPSSPDEIQGTNGARYDSPYASIVTGATHARLVIQNITGYDDLTWSGSAWVADTGDVPPTTTIGFGPELNVAGKYIFGGSTGGWKPASAGTYRVTFYLSTSTVSFADASLGDLGDDGVWVPAPAATVAEEGDEELPKAIPMLDAELDLTYVDLQVQGRH